MGLDGRIEGLSGGLVREYLTADTIATTVRMLRGTFPGSFLILEGDVDARLLKRFVDQSACMIQVAHSRSNVISVISILDADEFVGHVGLIDKDFADIMELNLFAAFRLCRAMVHRWPCVCHVSCPYQFFVANSLVGSWRLLAVVLKALVVLLDELLVAGGELFLDGVEDRVAIAIAEVAPGALRAAAMEPF